MKTSFWKLDSEFERIRSLSSCFSKVSSPSSEITETMLHNFTLLVLGGEWRGLAAGRGRELRADRALRAGVSEAVESQEPS